MKQNNEDQKIKDGINSTFDNVSKEYDNNKQFIISAKRVVEILKENNIKNNSVILDLSTGTGNIAIEVAKQYPNSNIHGVDISEKMLDIAKEKIKAQNIKNITLYNQDAENLKLDYIIFDIVICGYGLFFYPNMETVFCDISKKIKKGGKFIFSTFTKDAFQPYSKTFLNFLENNYNIKSPQGLADKSLETKQDIEKLAKLINPQNTEIEIFKIRLDLTIDNWWKLLNSSGFKGLIDQLDNDNYKKFKKEYYKYLENNTDNQIIKLNADTLFGIITI